MIKDIREILFICYGDARNASTWSNVPYCFVRALEQRGIVVSCVDIRPSRRIESVWNAVIKRCLNLFWRGNMYYFERSRLAMAISRRKIRMAVASNHTADLCVFTSFSYWNEFDPRPSLLLCDWTFEILLRDRCHREPSFFERWYIESQRKAIEGAALVVSLFKESARKMKETYPSANIMWPGINVINNLYDGEVGENLINLKKNSNIILFVGRPAYLEGARMLLDSMALIWERYPEMELHCVGIADDDLDAKDPRVKCYGYLHKDIPAEREIYYGLMCRARVFCNPSPEWAGYSSIVEAMYFYTPVVVSDFMDFVSEFGCQIGFGRYCRTGTADCLAQNLLEVISGSSYPVMCTDAHSSVKDYTWGNYASLLLKSVSQ